MADVLVFAASSFIGRHLCDAATRAGHRVVGTSRQPKASSGHLRCDLTMADSVEETVSQVRPEWIIQCGAATASRDARELYGTHIFGTLNVLQAVAKHAPQTRVLLMGSAAEYGAAPLEWLPLTEDRPAQPASFFGASKLAQTELAQAAAQEMKLKLVSVRPFNVIGPGLPDIYFATSLARRLLAQHKQGTATGTEFEVTNASATRDFVDVRDVATACLKLLARAEDQWPNAACEIFNICTGRETTLMDVATVLGNAAGGLKPIAGGAHASRGGISRSCGSAAKLTAATGWSPQISWQQSLNDLWTELVATADSQ